MGFFSIDTSLDTSINQHCVDTSTRQYGHKYYILIDTQVFFLDWFCGRYDFDAWKLDGCGGEYDLVQINAAIKKARRPRPPSLLLVPAPPPSLLLVPAPPRITL